MTEHNLFEPISAAIESGNVAAVAELLRAHPEMVTYLSGRGTWIHIAAARSSPEMIDHLASQGCDVNAVSPGLNRTALQDALTLGRCACVEALLRNGADPNQERTLLSAVVTSSKRDCEMLQLLEKHGADLHRVFPFGEDLRPINALSMARSYARQEIVEFLLARGARMPEQYSADEIAAYYRLDGVTSGPRGSDTQGSITTDVAAYFTQQFGPVDVRSLIEIVPSEPQIVVQFIPSRLRWRLWPWPARRKTPLTIFTTGLSSHSMTTPPEEPAAAAFRYAELFVQLPGDWNYVDYQDARFGWPIHWLRKLAQFPIENDTWLGGPVTVYDAGEALGPGLRFDSWLLMAERKLTASGGRLVQLFRMTPLYPEERKLEAHEGLPALMHAFDRARTSFVIDVNRKNVAE